MARRCGAFCRSVRRCPPIPPRATAKSAAKSAAKAEPKTAAKPAGKTAGGSGAPRTPAALHPQDLVRAAPAPEPIRSVVSLVTAAASAAGLPEGPTVLKKKELVERVVAASGVKKKDAKPVVEAMLAVLGESLASGRELNLAPLGKLRINRVEDKANGRVIVCKLRQPKDTGTGPDNPPNDPLAEAAE